MVDRGCFIVIEGADGSAKSTHAQLLAHRLDVAGRLALLTREPTDGHIGSLIRQALRGEVRIESPRAMAALFAADRHEHALEIERARAAGQIVICDRYELSNLVYRAAEQPILRCLGCPWTTYDSAAPLPIMCPNCDRCDLSAPRLTALSWTRALSRGAPRPTLTVVLDVPFELALERRRARGGAERYDDEVLQHRVCELYRRAAELLPGERVAVVDGTGDRREVAGRVWAAVEGVLS